MVVRRCGGAVRRGAGHRGQRLAVAGGDRAGGDARRRHRSAATLERGRQLAAAGDCAVCHTASEGATNAGGLAMATPFGTLYSTNITPDVATGIGNWSFTAFDRAMRGASPATAAICIRHFLTPHSVK